MISLKDFNKDSMAFSKLNAVLGGINDSTYRICTETTWAFDTPDISKIRYDDSGNFVTAWSEIVSPNPNEDQNP